MRRLLFLIALLLLGVTGCGSSSSGSTSPLNTELSYFPASSPFVMSVATDPHSSAVKGAQSLVNRFPIAAFGQTALMARLSQLGIDYQSQVRPLFGNPVVVGVTAAHATVKGGPTSFLAAWVTKDAGKLSALVKKLPGVHATGSHDGATLYRGGDSTTLAVDGATALVGASAGEVSAALDRHAHNGGITGSQYARAFTNLPPDGLIQAFGNLTGVLSGAGASNARQIPWVAALRGYAATVTASSSGLNFTYRLDTGGRTLTTSELPLAAGSAPPPMAGNMPISVGIEDPAHIFAFAETAERQASPAEHAKTNTGLNSLLRLTDGPLIVGSDIRTTVARAAVSDPRAAAAALSKLMAHPRSVFERAMGARSLGGGFYAIKKQRHTLTVGVTSGQLVAGRATPAKLRAFATAPVSQVAGTQGSVAFRITLAQLVRLGLGHAPPMIAQTVLKSLGDITGWINSGPSATTGSATLALH